MFIRKNYKPVKVDNIHGDILVGQVQKVVFDFDNIINIALGSLNI